MFVNEVMSKTWTDELNYLLTILHHVVDVLCGPEAFEAAESPALRSQRIIDVFQEIAILLTLPVDCAILCEPSPSTF